MTLLVSALTALLNLLSAGHLAVADGFITRDQDLRDKNHQEAFHEEDMMSSAAMGHCR